MDDYKYFSQLCESIVTEASTAMAQFNGPGAQEILKQLHSKEAFGHDVQPEPVVRPKWTDLKDKPGAWLLIAGNKGFGAVKFLPGSFRRGSGSYQLLASNGKPDPDEGNMVYSSFADNVTDANSSLKGIVGDAKKFYFVDSEYSKQLNTKRASNKPEPAGFTTTSKLSKRFKPLFRKILVASKADINGVIANMAKNDAHHKVDKKIEQVTLIDQAIEGLDNGNITDVLTNAVNNSIILTARYYYPELTGDVTNRWGYRNNSLLSTNNDGPTKVLSDIANGDREKLSAVLAYLKRSLV
jgi:Cu/Ag efflux protein CusF